MPGFMPGIHVFFCGRFKSKSGMAGPSPAMTVRDNEGLTSTAIIAISTPPGTSGLLAFGMENTDDGIDTIERRPR
jgi:hypothetical protein